MKTIRSLLPAICLLAFFAVFALINFKYMAFFGDGDVYADMLVAKEMWLQKRLFPANWVYGNQYYTVATPVLAALFYGMTHSLQLSMALATGAMSVLIVVSFLWMVRPFVKERWIGVCGLLLLVAAPCGYDILLLPQSQLFFVLASYYACYLITLFLCFGDYARAAVSPERGLRPLPLALGLVLSFLTGMQSLRQMVVMALPMLAAELLLALLRKLRGLPFWPKGHRQGLLRALLIPASNALGYLFMLRLRIPSVSIYGRLSVHSAASLSEKLHADWAAIRAISGLDAAVFDRGRLFFILVFFASVICVLTALVFLFRRRPAPDGAALLWLLCAVSLAAVLAASVVLDIRIREIYLFVWYPFLALSLVLILNSCRERVAHMLLIALCVLSLANLCFSYGPSFRRAAETDDSAYDRFCEDAEEAGIEYLYGEWSYAAKLALYSDGKLTAGLWGEQPYEILAYINIRDIYSPEDNERALYVLGPWVRDVYLQLAEGHGAAFTLFGEYGDCIAYRSSRQIMFSP